MKNKEIARLFNRIADALEIKGELDFKISAYRRAARLIDDLTEPVEKLAAEERLESIPGIGHGMAEKIKEYLTTGSMAKYSEALSGLKESLLDLLDIQGLGGKTIRLMNKELGVEDVETLRQVIADGSLAKLRGMGDKRVKNIKKGLDAREKYAERISIYEACILADAMVNYLESIPGVESVSTAGSLRRMKETVGDIDILCTGKNGLEIIQAFLKFPGITRVLAEGETKGSVVAKVEDVERQVDLRVVPREDYGAALLYFTGSKDHNIKLRGLAKDRGLKISEYGIFKGDKKIAGLTETDCYQVLDMAWIPPEMREDRGEIELALTRRLPMIVEKKDIKGDLHVHTNYSDGTLSLKDIVSLAKKSGYTYVAICDHSKSAYYAGGMTAARLEEQIQAIDRINRQTKNFCLLKGIEVDILADGRLDFPDQILKQLDFVVAAIHSGFKKNVTERIIKAIKNPWVKVIAHPTGRLISGREGYEVNIRQVIEAAAANGKALELNAYFDRLDLDENNLRLAKERRVKISLGTDTHHADGLDMMRFGLGIARRAWLEKNDILNSRSARQLVGKKIS